MNFKLECPRCDESFDTISRMPRMLIDCGHTICGECLKDLMKSGEKYICPDDNKVFIFFLQIYQDTILCL